MEGLDNGLAGASFHECDIGVGSRSQGDATDYGFSATDLRGHDGVYACILEWHFRAQPIHNSEILPALALQYGAHTIMRLDGRHVKVFGTL